MNFGEIPEVCISRAFRPDLRTLGVCIPMYRGALGFLPLRKPVHLVLGAPLELPPLTTPGQPTEEEVRRAHGKYVEALKLGDGDEVFEALGMILFCAFLVVLIAGRRWGGNRRF